MNAEGIRALPILLAVVAVLTVQGCQRPTENAAANDAGGRDALIERLRTIDESAKRGEISRDQAKRQQRLVLRQLGYGQRVQSREFPLRVVWEGEGAELQGTLSVDLDPVEGDVRVQLPAAGGTCAGAWAVTHGAYDTAVEPRGEWGVLCPNDVTARGEFRSPKPGVGYGAGFDSAKRKVVFVYGASSP